MASNINDVLQTRFLQVATTQNSKFIILWILHKPVILAFKVSTCN